MPTFTVTVKNDETGETKTVTVNTDNMETAIIPVVLSAAKPAAEPEEVSEEVSGAVTELEKMGLNKLFNNNTQGGRRSTPSFRLKKRRITRKLTKAR